MDNETLSDEPNEEDNTPMVFRILKGSALSSEYDAFCLLVPDDQGEFLCNALQSSKHRQHEWILCDEDIPEAHIPYIPADLAHPIRSIGESIPNSSRYTNESDLLDWLIHGESFFAKQYVVFEFEDSCCCGYDDDDDAQLSQQRVVFEVVDEKHLVPFLEASEIVCDKSWNPPLTGPNLIDRGAFLHEFGGKIRPFVVSDKVLKDFEEGGRIEDLFDFYNWVDSSICNRTHEIR